MEKKGARLKQKLSNWIKLVFFIYLFILSIEIIKKTSMLLAPSINNLISTSLTPLKAICTGWFTTAILQSSGAVTIIAATFAGNNLLSLPTAIYIIIGTILGSAITALIIPFAVHTKKSRDFRHGFEIGLCFAIYSVILIIITFILEYFFGIVSKTSFYLANLVQDKGCFLKIPDLIGSITSPIIDILKLNNLIVLLIGFAILILSLNFLGKIIIKCLGGEKQAKKVLNKYFDSKYKSLLIGIILTAIVFSSSITIGLLIPLIIARLITLKKAVPFIVGARLGTSADVVLASLIINQPAALATAIAYLMIGIVGMLIFIPNTNFLFRVTKHISKKTIHISRKKAIYFLIGFILIPLLFILIF